VLNYKEIVKLPFIDDPFFYLDNILINDIKVLFPTVQDGIDTLYDKYEGVEVFDICTLLYDNGFIISLGFDVENFDYDENEEEGQFHSGTIDILFNNDFAIDRCNSSMD